MSRLPKIFLVGMMVFLVVLPAQVAGYHFGNQSPKPVKKVFEVQKQKPSFILSFLDGFNTATSKVLGAATEAPKSLWKRFVDWLAGLFNPRPLAKQTIKTITNVPAPTSKPQVTEVNEVTEVIEPAAGVSAEDLAGVGLYAADGELNVNVGTTAYKIVQLDKNGKLPALNGTNLTDLDAADLTSGFINSDRLTGKYTAITGVGTIVDGKWEASVISDGFIANDLTINSINTESASDLNIDAKGGQLVLKDTQTLAIGGATTGLAYNVIGDNTTNASSNVASDDDLYIEGNLEVDGTIYGTVSGTISVGFTEGSVMFVDASGNLAQDNANFFWQDSTNELGLGDATPDDILDIESSILGYNFLFGTSGVTLSTAGTTGINVDTFGQLALTGNQGAANAVLLESTAGGIDISTGSGAAGNDIDILGGSSVNLKAYESVADAITVITYGAAGGIDISTGGQLGQGGSVDILSGQAAAAALTLVAPQGGIDISTGGSTQNIDILSGAGANLVAVSSGIDISTGGQGSSGGSIDILSGQGAATAITIVAGQGGIDISTGSGTQDIDILGGASLNLRSTEAAADSITIITNGSTGGIDISTGGQLGQGGSIDILGGQAAAAALTLVTPQGGIDISTGSGAAGNDIDILGGSSVNLRAAESVADAITIITNGAAGGIDLSTGGQLGQGGSIDILSGQAAAAALTLVAPQGGIDISTGSGAAGNDIDILGGSSVNISARESAADAITITTNSAAGGIDLSTGGQAGQGGSIDILSGNAAATALTLVTPQGGIDISTGSGAAGNDIDILGGSSVNLRAAESVADAITIITLGAAGGIDLSTGGQLGQGGSIDILGGQAAAAAITIVSAQGGIDISTGSGAAGNDIDLLSGSSINLTAREAVADAIVLSAVGNAGIDISTGYDAGAGRGLDILGGNTISMVSVNGDISISAGTAATSGAGITIDSATGMVGIGIANPSTYKLYVGGTMRVDCANAFADQGAYQDCSDVAELYPAASGSTLEAGDVLAFSASEPGKVAKSRGAYDGGVMGIYSTSPGMLVGRGVAFGTGSTTVIEDGQVPVALSGRVPVKVNNEGGAITVGDYLTTSSVPGYAMKASKEGTIIGMALGSFDGESGTVMMMVGKGYVAESVYEQMEVLAALGMAQQALLGGEVLGDVQADAVGDLVATTDGEVLAAGDEPLPVLKTQSLDELTVTTAAKFQGSLVVVGEAIFEGLLTVNGAEVKGDLGVVGAVTQTFTAGEDIAAGDAVYLSSENTVRKASAASEGTLPAVGVAVGSAGSGSSVKVAIAGTVNGLAGLNTGRRYYVGLGAGSITVSKPEGAAGVQVIGVARSASQLVVMPGLDYTTSESAVVAPTPEPVVEPTPVPTPEPTPLPAPEPTVVPEATSSSTIE